MQKCIDLNGDYVEKIGESLSFPKLYYSMPINIFFIVKNHWDPYFTDHPCISKWLGSCEHVTYEEIMKQRNMSDD
jgi:hypothetical protein